MKQIDFKGHEYWRLDHRSGKMVREFSPRTCRNYMILGLIMLGIAYWNRDYVNRDVLLGCVTMCSFATGGMFVGWLRKIY